MPKREPNSKCLYVLDTNVLMHDPSCLYRFEEHDLFLPMIVLEELDKKLKNEFRALCIRKEKTLTEEIQRLMKEELDREAKKHVR